MLTLLLSACTDPAVGNPQAGEQPPSCGRTESEIALGEPSSLGFAPEEVLAWLEGTHSTSFLLASDDVERDVNVTVTPDGTARFVDIEPAVEGACNDRVELGATVDFVTDDALFDESWPVVFAADGAAAAEATVAVDELAGAYVVPREAAEGCEATTLRFSLYASEGGGPSGELNLVCETERGGETMEGLIQLAVWGEGEFE